MLGVIACATPTVQPSGVASTTHDQLHAFPDADPGMERFVIALPDKNRDEETAFRVELVPGKIMDTDGVNQVRLDLLLEPTPLEGWGYTYYTATGNQLTAGTLMAVPPGTQPVRRFVAGTPLHIRYNSRLPIVVYLPEGCTLRYRIWSAPPEASAAGRG